jgi:uncharacterized glyoxalase superfamily protein PhnB
MKLNKLTPNLMVEDVDRTIQFYTEVLAFTVDQTVPGTSPFEWASMKSGDVEIMFQSRSSLAEDLPLLKELSLGGSLTFFVEMQGLQELYEQVRGKAQILQDLHTTFYGTREFSILDCNGYILGFAERTG